MWLKLTADHHNLPVWRALGRGSTGLNILKMEGVQIRLHYLILTKKGWVRVNDIQPFRLAYSILMPFSHSIYRFRVLQMRVCLFDIVHSRLIASRAECLNILQGTIRALFILQAQVFRTAVLQFGIHGHDVQEFGIVEL